MLLDNYSDASRPVGTSQHLAMVSMSSEQAGPSRTTNARLRPTTLLLLMRLGRMRVQTRMTRALVS